MRVPTEESVSRKAGSDYVRSLSSAETGRDWKEEAQPKVNWSKICDKFEQ